jgi:tetratricopeptide (TPR) repeat protein
MGPRRRLVSIFLAAAIGGVTAAPVPAVAQGAKVEEAYALCMELARRAPDDALAKAEALHKAGHGAPSRHCLATALLTLGRAAQAARVFFELARDFKDLPASERAEAYGQAGRAWLEAGDVARAEAAFSAALKVAPNDVLRLIDRAIARGAQGKDFEALDDLNRAVELAPRNADARILRAAASRRVGAGQLAEIDIDAALSIDPESPAAWLERGLLAESRKQTAAARAAFAKAMALDPEGPSGLTARAALARIGGVNAR